jgi:hypothetical protein
MGRTKRRSRGTATAARPPDGRQKGKLAPSISVADRQFCQLTEPELAVAETRKQIGAGREVKADSGGGAELYVVIGQAPRHLDRNVTVVGRGLQGMDSCRS